MRSSRVELLVLSDDVIPCKPFAHKVLRTVCPFSERVLGPPAGDRSLPPGHRPSLAERSGPFDRRPGGRKSLRRGWRQSGVPAAIASRTTFGSPSQSDGNTNKSAARSSDGTSFRRPAKWTRDARFSLATHACSVSRSGPSPTISTCKSAWRGQSSLTAAINTKGPFCGSSRPTNRSVRLPAGIPNCVRSAGAASANFAASIPLGMTRNLRDRQSAASRGKRGHVLAHADVPRHHPAGRPIEPQSKTAALLSHADA